MKAYKILSIITLGVAWLLISSCDTQFDKINTDPNRPSQVQTSGLLIQLQRQIAVNYYDSWQGLRMNGVIGQQWAQRTYTEEDRYDFGGRTGTVANFFNITYVYSEIANKIIGLAENDPTAAAYGDPKLQIASARILKAWLLIQNCETFGDVPYTEANQMLEFPLPKYDKQEFIFKDLIRELKEVNASLQGVTRGWTGGDNLLGGSPEKWRRFANSLRLQIAMRMSNVEPALSASEADAAIADGVMRDNDDNASFHFIKMGDPNEHPKYATYASRMDFVPSWQFVNMLYGNDDDNIGFKNPFKGIVDPRFVQFAQSPADQDAGLPVRYLTPPMGLTGGQNDAIWSQLAGPLRLSYGPTASRSDDILAKPVQASFWSTFLDFPNVALLVAERKNNDRSFFKQAIEASMGVWGVPATDADAYVNAVMNKFDAASAEGKFEMIITQKYIHNFAHYDQESVFEYRRTEYPKSVVLPGQQSGGVYNGVTYKFLPTDGGTIFLQRMLYPTSEDVYNKDNLNAARTAMGGDTQYIPLYYSKLYKK